MKIIHLSDIHFGNDNPAFDLKKLKGALNNMDSLFSDENIYIVISGDITLKGCKHGYEQAIEFFNETWLANENRKGRSRFLAYPGNHDICLDSFEHFDKFLYSIRRDHMFNFSQSLCHLLNFENISFLLVNSAHHLKKEYGLVDCDALGNLLEKNINHLTQSKHKVAVVHHHLLGVQKTNTSAIRNALSFISILDKYNLLLHRHQHSQLSLYIGKTPMKIFSSRSFNFATSGIVNGLSVLSYIQGSWERSEKVLSEDNSQISGLSFHSVEK